MGVKNLRKTLIIIILLVITLAAETTAWAGGSILVSVNQSKVKSLSGVTQVAIANPAIADVTVVAGEVLIIGKAPGSTTLYVWYGSEKDSYAVIVDSNETATAANIKAVIGYPGITVMKADKKIILEGVVNNQYERNRAEKIAKLYADDVANLLEMDTPKQVKIEVKVIEIASDKADKLGVEFMNSAGVQDGVVTLGDNGVFGAGQSFSNSAAPNGRSWFGNYADINLRVNALFKTGAAKLLSQPNIVTLSGEKASILIGGEIPVPVSRENDKITVEWREYGIKLNIEPTVDRKDNIRSKVIAEVSSIDYSSSVTATTGGIRIPPLKSRKAETTLQMLSGTTMAIGGLISSDESKNISKIPLLGDLPIIGHFFRTTSTSKERKEIVILITPTIVTADYMPVMSYEIKDLMQESKIRTERPVDPNKKRVKIDDMDGIYQ